MYGCLLHRRAVKERQERCFNCKERISDVLENENFKWHKNYKIIYHTMLIYKRNDTCTTIF